MDKNDIFGIITGISGIIAIVLAVINEEYRLFLAIISVILIVVFTVGRNYQEINFLKDENKKINERLKIHKDLVNIKADLESLKRGKRK